MSCGEPPPLKASSSEKGLITSDLLVLCAGETVLKILIEQSKFLINFDRFFFLIIMSLSLQAPMHIHNSKP